MAKYEWATKFEGQDGSTTSWKKRRGEQARNGLGGKTSFFARCGINHWMICLPQ